VAEASSAAREYLRLNQELGDLARQVFALAQLGLVATYQEDFLAARSWHEQALRLARTMDDRFNIVRVCYMLGTVHRLLGDNARAAELFAEAASLIDTNDPFARAWEWIFSADLAVDGGQYERAAELYWTALRHFQRVGFRPWMNLVTQRIGTLAIRKGNPECGVRILSAPQTHAMALLSMFPAVAYERRRAFEDARVLLGEETFAAESSLGLTLTLDEAVVEAFRLTHVEPSVASAARPLTPRQYEVGALIARGLTNAQIAERLVVSPHTVERQVENILDRLRLSSRIEVAVWMVEHARG
jgi:DNA-binding NarL/FixJ family response regulator